MNKQDVVKENVGYDESYSEAKCPSTRLSINEKARMESWYLQRGKRKKGRVVRSVVLHS